MFIVVGNLNAGTSCLDVKCWPLIGHLALPIVVLGWGCTKFTISGAHDVILPYCNYLPSHVGVSEYQPIGKPMYSDCKNASTRGQTTSGVYTIQPDNQPAFQVYCDMETDGGGWTVFQRRMDGSVNFYRNWTDYEQGFGNLSGEFWLGLDKIHRLTSTATQLRIDLQDFEGKSAYAQYTSFSIGDSSSKYILSVSGYSGTAGDSFTSAANMSNYRGYQYSTRDQDNDRCNCNCAQTYKGAWWYGNCHLSNLNGLYHGGPHSSYADGVNWYTMKGYHYSLKFTEMKLRQSKMEL